MLVIVEADSIDPSLMWGLQVRPSFVLFLTTELSALQKDLKPFGLVVLGFPCNQFGKQEPGENTEILPGLK